MTEHSFEDEFCECLHIRMIHVFGEFGESECENMDCRCRIFRPTGQYLDAQSDLEQLREENNALSAKFMAEVEAVAECEREKEKLEAELASAREALKSAQQTICGEWCSFGYHAEPCREITEALGASLDQKVDTKTSE